MAHPSIPNSLKSCLTSSRCCGTVIQRKHPRICRNSPSMSPTATQCLRIRAAASLCCLARQLSSRASRWRTSGIGLL
eukprot:11183605-Lingulodinium_polyedra.AAC.1